MRKEKIKRSTKETTVECIVNIDGTGINKISTKIGFLDHMLEIFSNHSLIDLEIKAEGEPETVAKEIIKSIEDKKYD